MKKDQKDAYGFSKVGKNKFVYHPWKKIFNRGYIVTYKQRNKIIEFREFSIMILSIGLIFFVRKRRFSSAHLEQYFLSYYLGMAYYVLAIIFLKIKRHLLIKGCERVKCKRESIFCYMKSLTSTLEKRHILLLLAIAIAMVMLERYFIYQYKAGPDIPSLIFIWIFGFLTFFVLLMCYKMIIFKIEYKNNLRKNLCTKEYENHSITASDVMYLDWKGMLITIWSRVWLMFLILFVMLTAIIVCKILGINLN